MKNKLNKENRLFKPVKISESLKKINQNFLYKFGELDYIIHSKWSEIVGKFFDQFSEPNKILSIPENEGNNEKNYSRILHVNVSPAIAVEFQHYQNKIIEKINSYFGFQAINKIKIHQKQLKKNDLIIKKNNYKVNTKEDISIAKLPSKINNDKLKKSLVKLGISIKDTNENNK